MATRTGDGPVAARQRAGTSGRPFTAAAISVCCPPTTTPLQCERMAVRSRWVQNRTGGDKRALRHLYLDNLFATWRQFSPAATWDHTPVHVLNTTAALNACLEVSHHALLTPRPTHTRRGTGLRTIPCILCKQRHQRFDNRTPPFATPLRTRLWTVQACILPHCAAARTHHQHFCLVPHTHVAAATFYVHNAAFATRPCLHHPPTPRAARCAHRTLARAKRCGRGERRMLALLRALCLLRHHGRLSPVSCHGTPSFTSRLLPYYLLPAMRTLVLCLCL